MDFRLRTLPFLARFGLTCLLLVMLGGLAASARHMVDHHENRDERPGLTLDDLRGAYHGLRSTAPLLRALDSNHPAELDGATALSEADRTLLLGWLNGDRISEDYDNLDLGDAAPAEVLAVNCLSCHARQAAAGDGVGQRLPLEFWDDVRSVAFSREINRTSDAIIITSIHTHALGLAPLGLVLAFMLLGTGLPRFFASTAIAVIGVGLLVDLGGQWLTRTSADFVWLIVAGGAMFGVTCVLATLVTIVDLWLPRRAE